MGSGGGRGRGRGFFFKKLLLPMKPLYSLNFIPKIRKILRAVFEKKKSKTPFFDPVLTPFCPKMGQGDFFFKKRFSSLFYIYHHLTVSRKSEKSLEPIPLTLRH